MSGIATGLWFDYTQPTVIGWTITLPIDQGNILLSALTFLVTIAGASAWTITAALLHSRLVNHRHTPCIVDLQQQVALRNSSGALGTLLDSLRIHQAWSKARAGHLWGRTISLAVPALVIWVGFAAASILTSRVATKSYGDILVRSSESNCGQYLWPDPANMTLGQEDSYTAKVINDTRLARSYASSFYVGDRTDGTSLRSIFPVSRLPITTDDSATCPVANQTRCVQGPDTAFRMKTPQLDSTLHLGINAKPADRISFQMMTTCAMADVSGYLEVVDGSIEYWLGPDPPGDQTYLYHTDLFIENIGYQIYASSAFGGDDPASSDWHPVSEFNRNDADMTMIFLSQNSVRYMSPVYDPLFLATRPSNNTSGDSVTYLSTNFINPLMCADQYAICNPTTSICTPPGGRYATEAAIAAGSLGLNDAQAATTSRLMTEFDWLGSWVSVDTLGASALYAGDHVYGGLFSTSLPSTQWQLEVLGWFQTSLARLQARMLEYAHKPSNLSADLMVFSPYGAVPNSTAKLTQGNIDAYQSQCRNQLIQSNGEVQNFSFLGVLIVVCVSLALVVLGLALPGCMKLGKRHKGWTSLGKRARQADDKLHLLRIALSNGSGAGVRHWEEGVWDVPVERGENRVARPDVENGLTSYDGAKGERATLLRN